MLVVHYIIKAHKHITQGTNLMLRFAIAAAVLAFSSATASIVDLGNAEGVILGTGGYGSINLGSSSVVNGGVSSDYYVNLGSNTVLNGELCSPAYGAGPGSQFERCSSSPSSNSLYSDILAASNVLSKMEPSQPTFDITNSKTLTSGVYSVNNFRLEDGETLKLTGGVNDTFVININGLAKLSPGSQVLLDGVSSSNVFFNLIGSKGRNQFKFSGSDIAGTFLSNSRKFIIGTGMDIEDARFLTNGSIIAHFNSLSYSPSPGEAFSVSSPICIGFLLMSFFTFISFKTKTFIPNKNKR